MAKIIRAREESNFTILPNQIMDDERLSWTALGLLNWFLRLPPDWEIGGVKQLAARKRGSLRHEGRDVIATSLRELEQAGYLSRVRRQDPETGRWETVTEVRSRPVVPESKPQVTPSPGKPGPGKPGLGEPGPGKPGRMPKDFHQELPPPTPRAEPAGAAVAEQAEAGRQEETEGKDQDQAATTDPATDRAAAELVDGLVWPGTLQPNQRTMTTLRRHAAACLAAGHHPDAVREQALDAMPGAKTAGSVVARLRDLATRTPDPAVAAAAEREAVKAEQERMANTSHQYEPARAGGYCARCLRPEVHRVHREHQERVDQDQEPVDHQEPAAVRSEAPDTGQASPTGRCQHGRRVCVTCHGGRPDDTTSSGDRQRPAPRQRPAADPDPAPGGPTPAGQEFHRALAAMAGRMVAA